MASRMRQSVSFWALFCKSDHGGYLFHRNPNPGWGPYHLGSIENLLDGEMLVQGRTRRELEMDMGIATWNADHPWYKVSPRRVTLEISPYGNREGGAGEREAKQLHVRPAARADGDGRVLRAVPRAATMQRPRQEHNADSRKALAEAIAEKRKQKETTDAN